MDFQSLAHGGGNVGHGVSVIEDSFKVTISSSGLFSWGTGEDHYAGSTGLWGGAAPSTITLSRVDTNPFSIQSINLADWIKDSAAGQTVNFLGTFSVGGTISKTVSLPGSVGSPTFATYAFGSGWTGLSKVEWVQNFGNLHQFDDIVLDSPLIPLPGGAAMALVGMGVMGVRRRRN